MKTEDPNLENILQQMSTFGLELDHIETELLKAGDRYQIYFFLDPRDASYPYLQSETE